MPAKADGTYTIVTGDVSVCLDDFEEEVNLLKEAGWDPEGGARFIIDPDSKRMYIFQTMIR